LAAQGFALQGLQGLQVFLAAHGLQGLHAFLAAHGLQGLHAFFAAQALQAFFGAQDATAPGMTAVDAIEAIAAAVKTSLNMILSCFDLLTSKSNRLLQGRMRLN
tara:strand:- start:141 stop:452 length:312 start_codon:yes stop_codon:yes gene_type:complete